MALLAAKRATAVDEALAAELERELAPVSRSYLRKLLRNTFLPLAPLVEGIRQDSFESLERTLAALETEYRSAGELGDRDRMQQCRATVIEAKNHARLALRREASEPGRRAEREEMIRWMLVWLENPPLFHQWVVLRRKAQASSARRIPPE